MQLTHLLLLQGNNFMSTHHTCNPECSLGQFAPHNPENTSQYAWHHQNYMQWHGEVSVQYFYAPFQLILPPGDGYKLIEAGSSLLHQTKNSKVFLHTLYPWCMWHDCFLLTGLCLPPATFSLLSTVVISNLVKTQSS